ncbi:uncharacterized protein EI97DRAFT_456523 [Westerdykella ornata]|uniref:Rhodopsin domain-containing protein n=1 Tax=Westerdykella ornata TaxID=318751 RepID=A0A6A6JR57_WESOR|nr:uncharacterized protein EI97DRAFT_456523 [Westerdykella ornata]KAF2279130.1 hypothetical protein EI97DRAFT_456523 [Westerdykella ornata]
MEDDPSNANPPPLNRPETILGVVISFVVLANIAIALRLYVRIRARLLGWDDLFVVLAGIAVTIGSSLTCLMPDYGLGKHFWTLTVAHRMEYFKHIWSTNAAYTASTTCIKLALLLQYLRLFDISSRKLPTTLTRAMIILISLWGATFFLLALFSCRPIAKNWNWMLPGTCVAWGSKDANVFFACWAAHAASNMMFDILVFALPTPFLRDLRMQGKTRVGLVALFSLGGIVVILSIARLISLCLKRAGTVPVFDPSYATPSIYIFSVLEVNIAILCASIPIFWPLVTSLSLNQIFVVNEIEVRSQRRGSAPRDDGGAPVGIPGFDVEMGKRLTRVSAVVVYEKEGALRGRGEGEDDDDGLDFKCRETVKRPTKALSKSNNSRHLHNDSKHSDVSYFSSSSSSGGKSLQIEIGRRFSQESQRGLNTGRLAHCRSETTLGGSERSGSP